MDYDEFNDLGGSRCFDNFCRDKEIYDETPKELYDVHHNGRHDPLGTMMNHLTGTYFTFNEFGKRKRELEAELRKKKKEKKEIMKNIRVAPSKEVVEGFFKTAHLTNDIGKLEGAKKEMIKLSNKLESMRKRQVVNCSTCNLPFDRKNSHVKCGEEVKKRFFQNSK